ncbi:MAG: hypothetical protein EXR75_01660 [Myxococcales bacterium]|nr:hypothetical protein [Myxococcales bacterium]
MRLFSTPTEFGIIGVGQVAHGIFAFGQFARGVVAVGQVAIGVVAIGQVAFSLVGVGMGGVGVVWFGGMFGVGGRGLGLLVIKLLPGLEQARTPPTLAPLDAVWQGQTRGFVHLDVMATASGPVLAHNGQAVPVKFIPQVLFALRNAATSSGLREIYASLRREGTHVVCDALVEVPGTRANPRGLASVIAHVLKFAVLVVLAAAWFVAFTEGTDRLKVALAAVGSQ